MQKILALSLILLAFPLAAPADTIIFRDGMRVEASEVWEKDGEVKCKIGDIVFGYPKGEVERIEKGRMGAKKAAAPILKVNKKVTTIPRKEAAILKKDTASPNKKAETSRKVAIPPKKQATVSKKTVPAQKEIPKIKKKASIPQKAKIIPKKKKAKKAVAPEYASLPAFKVFINEDDNNPPVYIKRRRVLLVPRGLTKVQVRTLLLRYEKKLRNELRAQKAEYKQIMIWAYDDFKSADEGAGGWVGMITNDTKTGKLSDDPKLSVR